MLGLGEGIIGEEADERGGVQLCRFLFEWKKEQLGFLVFLK